MKLANGKENKVKAKPGNQQLHREKEKGRKKKGGRGDRKKYRMTENQATHGADSLTKRQAEQQQQQKQQQQEQIELVAQPNEREKDSK